MSLFFSGLCHDMNYKKSLWLDVGRHKRASTFRRSVIKVGLSIICIFYICTHTVVVYWHLHSSCLGGGGVCI